MEKLQKAKEEHGFQNVWSNDGKILYIDANEHNRVKVFTTNFSNHGLGFDYFTTEKNFVSFVSFYFKVLIVYWGTCTLFRVEKKWDCAFNT